MTGEPIVQVRPSPAVREWSKRNGFTPELVARWVEFHPRPQELLESLLRPVPRYFRVNTLQADASRLERTLKEREFALTPVESPSAGLPSFRLDKEPFAIASTPENLMGQLYVQDLASLSAPAALEPGPGDVVLDMAAAPGGKTTAIAQLTRDVAPVLAVEPVAQRAAALTANLRRLGITSVAVNISRAEELPVRRRFDRILLDAPCTGEGVLPRDPHRRTGDLQEHSALAALQRRLMTRAVELLEPGGVLVYSACTFSPEECEGVVDHAINLGLEAEPLPFSSLNGIALDPALEQAGGLRFSQGVRHARRVYPDRHHTLGFFLARLRKVDASPLAPRTREGVAMTQREKKKEQEKEAARHASASLTEGSEEESVGVAG